MASGDMPTLLPAAAGPVTPNPPGVPPPPHSLHPGSPPQGPARPVQRRTRQAPEPLGEHLVRGDVALLGQPSLLLRQPRLELVALLAPLHLSLADPGGLSQRRLP